MADLTIKKITVNFLGNNTEVEIKARGDESGALYTFVKVFPPEAMVMNEELPKELSCGSWQQWMRV